MDDLIKNYISPPIVISFLIIAIFMVVVIFVLIYRSNNALKRLDFMKKLAEFGVDGYFAFKKKTEECSKQLALLLMLDNGEKSSFNDVLSRFSKVDAVMLANALNRDNAVLKLKSLNNIYFTVISRIFYDADDNVMAKVLYFKNITEDQAELEKISSFGEQNLSKSLMLENATDVLPFPVFIRNDKLEIVYCNTIYARDMGILSKQKAIDGAVEPLDREGLNEARALAAAARKSGEKMRRLCRDTSVVKKLITEVPFVVDDKVFSLGYYGDSSASDTKNDARLSENDYLRLFDVEDIAVAHFAADLSLVACNSTFISMWDLDEDFVKKEPSYLSFLDQLYLKKTIPVDTSLERLKRMDIETIADKKTKLTQITLPNGSVIDRMFISDGYKGTIVLYKDVSVEIMNKRYQTAKTVSFNVLNNIKEGIALFGADKTLKTYNTSFARMWKMDTAFLDSNPLITEVFDRKKSFFMGYSGKNWLKIKNDLMNVVNGETVIVENIGGKSYEISGTLMPDSSIMLCYTDISEQSSEKRKNAELKESFEVKHKMLNDFIYENKKLIEKNISDLRKISGNKKLVNAVIEKMSYLREKIQNTSDIIDTDIYMHLLAPDVIDVKKMIIEVLEMLHERIEDKKIVLSTSCPDDIDWITADEKLIKHMLLFILSSIVGNIAVSSDLVIKVLKQPKKEIADNMVILTEKDNNFYLVISVETHGEIISEGLDLFTVKNENDRFGTNNRLMQKIIHIFDGFFILDNNKSILKICLPYHN